MLDLFSSFSTLNCIYFFMLMAGIIWTVVVLIGGAVSSVDLPDIDFGEVDASGIDLSIDHDVGFDHGSVEVSALSPITIASFVTSFGGLGLIATQLLGIPEPASLFVAALGAALIAGGMFMFYSRVLVAGQGSSAVQLGELKGKKAEIIIPIPKGGMGQVALVSKGTRTTWSARSVDGNPVPSGTVVTIEAVTGNTIIVSR
jgi:membrane protein implicated in regulation of membrane protease activity